MKRLLPIALAVAALAGCSGRATPVEITNRSPHRVWDLRVHGNGFEAFVGRLQPGESVDIEVYPAGETGIGLQFWTSKGAVELPPDGYFESGGMYSAKVVIAEDLGVKVDTALWPR